MKPRKRRRRRRNWSSSVRCYCAFCRVERRINIKSHLSVLDVLLCVLVSVLLSFILWQDLDPKACIFFALALGVAELFVLLRWRLAMPCRSCGFDPVVYKKNPQLAAERVKKHLDRRREDPALLLAPRPRIPVLVKRTRAGLRVTENRVESRR